jgi:hypothetical protein
MASLYNGCVSKLWKINQEFKKNNIRNEPELSKVEKIVCDNTTILENSKLPKKIDKLLIISGGGLIVTVFTLGAIARLIEDGSFYTYDIIGAVSGSSIVLHFIDLCYQYNLVGTKDWFQKYVREPIYKVLESKIIFKLLQKYGYETVTNSEKFLSRLNELLIPQIITKNKKRSSSKYKKPVMLFNYVNVNTKNIDNNHDDIKNCPNFYIKRVLRCCSTIINFTFENKSTYDSGIVDNIAISKMLNSYVASSLTTIISTSDTYLYEKVRMTNGFLNTINLITLYFNTSDVANFMNTIEGSEDLMNRPKILCFLSSDFHKSKDPIHKGLFKNKKLSNAFLSILYIAYPTKNNMEMLRVFENEGYIQMFSTSLQNKKKSTQFNIPNKEYYDRQKAKQIYQTFQERDVIQNISNFFQNISDFINIQTNTHFLISDKLNL